MYAELSTENTAFKVARRSGERVTTVFLLAPYQEKRFAFSKISCYYKFVPIKKGTIAFKLPDLRLCYGAAAAVQNNIPPSVSGNRNAFRFLKRKQGHVWKRLRSGAWESTPCDVSQGVFIFEERRMCRVLAGTDLYCVF